MERLLSLSVNGIPSNNIPDPNLGGQSGPTESTFQANGRINDTAPANVSFGNDTSNLSINQNIGIASRSVWNDSKAVHQIKRPSDSTSRKLQDRHYAVRKPTKSKSKHGHSVDKTQIHVQGRC